MGGSQTSEIDEKMLKITGQLNALEISKEIANSGDLAEIPNDVDEFFQEQLDDEISIAERARRIDDRLKDFDDDFDVSSLTNLLSPIE